MALGAAGLHVWLICPQKGPRVAGVPPDWGQHRGYWPDILTCMKMLMCFAPQRAEMYWSFRAGERGKLEHILALNVFFCDLKHPTRHLDWMKRPVWNGGEKQCTMTSTASRYKKHISQRALLNRSKPDSLGSKLSTYLFSPLRKQCRDLASCVNYSVMLFSTLWNTKPSLDLILWLTNKYCRPWHFKERSLEL